MSEDWYEKPKLEKNAGKNIFIKILKYIWAAILSGVISGIIFAIFIVILSYIENKTPVLENIWDELQAVTLLLLIGGGIGLVVGAPAALIFGTFSGFVTKKIEGKKKIIFRILIGILGSMLTIYFLIYGFAQTSPIDLMDMIFAAICGFLGSLIFIFFEPKDKAPQNELVENVTA